MTLPPRPDLYMCGEASLRRQEGAIQVDGQHFLPLGKGKLLNRVDDLDAGVADQDVHAAKFGDDGRHAVVDGLLVGDVHRQAHRDSLVRADFLRRGVRRLLLKVGDGHLGSLAREAEGDGLSDAAGGAGDDGGFFLESHGYLRSNGHRRYVLGHGEFGLGGGEHLLHCYAWSRFEERRPALGKGDDRQLSHYEIHGAHRGER